MRRFRDLPWAYGVVYRWTVRRVAPARWLFGALLLPGTPARAALVALSVAAWEDLDSGA